MRSFFTTVTVLLAGLTTNVIAAPTAVSSLMPRYEGTEEVSEALQKRDYHYQQQFLGDLQACAYAELFFGDNNLLSTEPSYEGVKAAYWYVCYSLFDFLFCVL